jgi:hypothetical protein
VGVPRTRHMHTIAASGLSFAISRLSRQKQAFLPPVLGESQHLDSDFRIHCKLFLDTLLLSGSWSSIYHAIAHIQPCTFLLLTFPALCLRNRSHLQSGSGFGTVLTQSMLQGAGWPVGYVHMRVSGACNASGKVVGVTADPPGDVWPHTCVLLPVPCTC